MTFVPEPGFEDQARREGIAAAERFKAAERIRDAAKRAAPGGGTGAYARSLEALRDGTVVRVLTTDPAGHLVEFGSVNNQPYAPIRTGVSDAGYDLAEDPPNSEST